MDKEFEEEIVNDQMGIKTSRMCSFCISLWIRLFMDFSFLFFEQLMYIFWTDGRTVQDGSKYILGSSFVVQSFLYK